MRSALIILSIMLSSAASATTINIDFEGTVVEDGPYARTQGFEFYSEAGFIVSSASPPSTSIVYCPDCAATMTSLSGQPFDLMTLDLWNMEFVGTGDATVSLTGHFVGGGQISTNLLAPASAWSSHSLDASWSNLELLEFSMSSTGTAIGLDNIVVSTVPVPAAIWLFGSALAGLGWLRRKQTG